MVRNMCLSKCNRDISECGANGFNIIDKNGKLVGKVKSRKAKFVNTSEYQDLSGAKYETKYESKRTDFTL